ncbi:MAG: hypothetical protein F4Z12_10640 [Acidobacteria bacterium]|nr:hypothetical protein [Acidobacteriota bacterium]
MSVISIEPAPGKTSTVCDGTDFYHETPAQLRDRLRRVNGDALLCWDAPLTGPQDPDHADMVEKDFSQRCIDSFFTRKETEFKTPKGISVLPYSDRPHWVITRSLLGLPRTGRFDVRHKELPFRLLPGEEWNEYPRPGVVEIHPAVAAWLWCRGHRGFPSCTEPWRYKSSKEAGLRAKMWQCIRRQTGDVACPNPLNGDGDAFDAAVGYLLGVLFVRDRARPESRPTVILLGDRKTGSFLVPNVGGLLESWRKFVEKWPKVRNH